MAKRPTPKQPPDDAPPASADDGGALFGFAAEPPPPPPASPPKPAEPATRAKADRSVKPAKADASSSRERLAPPGEREPKPKPATPSRTAGKPRAEVKPLPPRLDEFGDPIDEDDQPGESRVVVPAPVALTDITGQEAAMSTLRASMAAGRVHHAWIFHGPDGVGKLTTALAFAAVLLDPDGLGVEPPSRRAGMTDEGAAVRTLLAAGTHPDLHLIVKELAGFHPDANVRKSMQTTIAKAVIDEFVLGQVSRSAQVTTSGRASRVFVIEQAELLGPAGQNALLKTLEEPPAGAVLILVTTSEGELLPTIRSRCQRVPFVPLGEADLERWAMARGLSIGPGVRDRLLSYAGGSPGRLLEAVETGITEWFGAVDPLLEQVAGGRLSTPLGGVMAKLADEWAARRQKAREKLGERASKAAANREAASRMLALVAEWLRPGLAHPESVTVAAEALQLIAHADAALDANVQLPHVFEHLSQGLVMAFQGRATAPLSL